mgnify:FL=1
MKNKHVSSGQNNWRPDAKISAEDCKSIIELYEDSPQKEATMFTGTNTDIRNGTVNFHNEQWVYDLIWPYMQGSNINAGWDFEISAAEDYQISKYEVGDFYSTHMDCLGTNSTKWIQNDNSILHNKTRKISMSLILNDDYEGGELILFDVGPMKQEVGTMIFFPSFLPHEVTPVTKGTRYSLVMWFLGNPWR